MVILAELFEADSEEFIALVMCNDRAHLQQFIELTQFAAKVEMDVVDFGDRITFQ